MRIADMFVKPIDRDIKVLLKWVRMMETIFSRT